jgi:hypothetical protein
VYPKFHVLKSKSSCPETAFSCPILHKIKLKGEVMHRPLHQSDVHSCVLLKQLNMEFFASIVVDASTKYSIHP